MIAKPEPKGALATLTFDAYAVAETTLAGRLLDRFQPGMLCLADRGFVGFELWQAACATKAELLWRLRANQVFACETALPDGSYLSRLYGSPAHRRRQEGGVPVRIIDYQLDGVPAAEPMYRLITTLLDADGRYPVNWKRQSGLQH